MMQTSVIDETSAYPVLDGLACAGVAGKSLAGIVGVSAPTLSKWRNGRSRMGGSQLVFLTLVLAHYLEEIEAMKEKMGTYTTLNSKDHFHESFGGLQDDLQGFLHEQEIRNLALPPSDVHAGARLYRTWFEQTSGTVFLPMLSQASPATYPPTQHLQEA